jgi:hypothetical protein
LTAKISLVCALAKKFGNGLCNGWKSLVIGH